METKTGNQNGKPKRHSNLRIVLHVLLCNSDPRVASRKRAGCPYFFSLVVRPPGGRRCEEQSYCAGDFYLSFAKQAGAVPAEKPLSFLHGTRTPTRVCRQAIRLTGGQLAVLTCPLLIQTRGHSQGTHHHLLEKHSHFKWLGR